MSATAVRHAQTFVHEALLYAGEDGFVDGVAPFLRAGVEAGEPVLVVVSARKIGLLRDALNGSAGHVLFADMAEVGMNPARIIPAWQDFVSQHVGPGRPARGVGEPIWDGRGADELVECQRHESLLNLAFAGSPAWRLLCPYDTLSLPAAVLEEALCSHPVVVRKGVSRPSTQFRGLEQIGEPFAATLPEPPPGADELAFDADTLAGARALVYRRAVHASLEGRRAYDFALAANEIFTNSIRHGGGAGLLRIWEDDGALVCEVSDRGRIEDPLADRRRPRADQPGGRGLWMANQLCDLVQIRQLPDGSVVRLSMRRA